MRDVEGLPNEDLRERISNGSVSEYYVADMLGMSFEGFEALMAQPLSPKTHAQVISILRQARSASDPSQSKEHKNE